MNALRRFVLAAVFAGATGWSRPAAAAELTLLQTADLHGETGRFPGLTEMVERTRRAAGPDRFLWIDCGDTAQGTFAAAESRGMCAVEFLNAAGCDIWVPGNHDFEYGPERLIELIAAFRGTALGANWKIREFTPPATKILKRGRRTVAVIGVGEPGVPERLAPGSGVIGTELETAIRREIVKLRKQRCDLVILAIHTGRYFRGGNLGAVLRKFPEIALVLGGHTHQREPGVRIGQAWFVQSGQRGAEAALIEVDFPAGARPVITSELIPVPAGQPDPIPAEARKILYRSPVPLHNPDRRERNPALPELALRAMREAANADAAIHLASSARAGAPEFTALDRFALYRLFPFENRIFSLELNAAELETVMRELEATTRKRKMVLAYSGFTRTPGTGKIVLPAGKTRLRVAMADYYLGGAAGVFPELGKLARARPLRDSGLSLRRAVERTLTASASAPAGAPAQR